LNISACTLSPIKLYRHKADENCKKKFTKIKLLNALSSDQNWKIFEIYFEETNPKFIKRLKEKHSNLTAKEVNLAIMVRLNMDIKETTSTMNIEPNSVKIARYRLRKNWDCRLMIIYMNIC